MNRIAAVAICLLGLVACVSGPDPSRGAVDLVFHNAKVWTGNPEQPWAEWVAIRGDRIATVGSGSELPTADRSVDLGGRLYGRRADWTDTEFGVGPWPTGWDGF